MLQKQAKILNDHQIKAVLAYLDQSKRNREKNKVMFLLSLHGLRSKSIADVEVEMVLDGSGEVASAISLQNKASKGSRGGRVIPMNRTLQLALGEYLEIRKFKDSKYLITTERSEKTSANAVAVFFKRLYQKLGYVGCSSHSGRRTFITKCARKISQVGGSLKDVMDLSGHSAISSVQLYIQTDPEAQSKLVNTIYSL